jgi:TonB family protein
MKIEISFYTEITTMKNLTFLYLALLSFSCSNPPTNDTSYQSPDIIIPELETKADTNITAYNQDYTYEPASNHKGIQGNESFAGFASFYKQFEKPSQTFNFKSDEDKLIACKEGTIIYVKSNSFVTESGKPVKGDLNILVKEYYASSDMLLANLTTTSDGKILETGGMIYIEAFHNNEKCELKKDASIEISFPTSDKKDDMQLFSGDWNSNEVNWTLSRTRSVYRNEIPSYTTIEVQPQYSGGEQALMKFLSKTVKYPVNARESGIQGTVYVGFTVKENGELGQAEIVRGVHPFIDSAAISAVRQMPAWIPAKHKGKNVEVKLNLPVRFSLGKKNSSGVSNQITSDTIRSYFDWEVAQRIEREKEFEEKMNDENLGNAQMTEISRYLFDSPSLGWINCDRFYKDNSPKVNYSVNIGQSKDVDIKIVFKDIQSIMTGMSIGGICTFGNVPIGHSVTIVALKYENSQYYLAVKETKITKDGVPNLDFEPVTMARLKSELKKLNKT